MTNASDPNRSEPIELSDLFVNIPQPRIAETAAATCEEIVQLIATVEALGHMVVVVEDEAEASGIRWYAVPNEIPVRDA